MSCRVVASILETATLTMTAAQRVARRIDAAIVQLLRVRASRLHIQRTLTNNAVLIGANRNNGMLDAQVRISINAHGSMTQKSVISSALANEATGEVFCTFHRIGDEHVDTWMNVSAGIVVALITGASAALDSTSATSCEQEAEDGDKKFDDQVNSEDVKAFVKTVLSDDSINMRLLPDIVESQLYETTVRLVLSLIYRAVGALDGMKIIGGHELRLVRTRESIHEIAMNAIAHQQSTGIDEKVLEEVADRLLQNKAVNYTLIPDVIEKQVYVNCLKLVVRLLDTLANTLSITLCGHDLKLYFQPSADRLKRAVSATSSTTQINVKILQEAMRDAHVEDGATSIIAQQLLTSIYTLLLGILDDILANTELDVLNDRISIDVIPGKRHESEESPAGLRGTAAASTTSTADDAVSDDNQHDKTSDSSLSPIVPFLSGVGVGAVTVVVAGLVSSRSTK